jgi:hypothetical protein
MITNDKRQDGYLFVLDTIEGTEESLAQLESEKSPHHSSCTFTTVPGQSAEPMRRYAT